MEQKILIGTDKLTSLISWIPNDGGPSAALINGILEEVTKTKLEVVARGNTPLQGPGDEKVLLEMAAHFGCVVVFLTWWPTTTFVIKNVPTEWVGKAIWIQRRKGVEYTEEKILKMVKRKIMESFVSNPPSVTSYEKLTDDQKRFVEANRLLG